MYEPVDPRAFPRFAGIKTFMRLPHIRTTEGIDFAIVGIPWDGGASFRTGQRSGPDAIRKVSALLKAYNAYLDVQIFEHCSGVDFGDLTVVPGYIEETYKRIEEELLAIVEAGVVPISLGGDHSITLPELRAIAEKHGPVALIHFDSHNDTHKEYFGRPYNHGTPFQWAVEEKLIDTEHSLQIGIRGTLYSPTDVAHTKSLGFDIITMEEVRCLGISGVVERIHSRADNLKVFVTFDIDVVDPAFAPGTGTPEIGGLTSAEAVNLVRGLKGLNLVGADIVEVLPEFDPTEITALLASNIVYELISLIAVKKKGNA